MTQPQESLTLRVGGVPEHFNSPWYIALGEGDFAARPYEVTWRDFPGGTGAMCKALEDDELDVAVLLADGVLRAITQGSPIRIIGTYVDSPLYWGIHVHADSPIEQPGELAGQTFAISRIGSGSHLMSYVEAHARGWLGEHTPEFEVVGGLEGAREALARGSAQGFLWERLMTRPLVDAGEWRQIGVRPSPWPAFLVAARQDVIQEHGEVLQELLTVVQRRCHEMKIARQRTIRYVEQRFGLPTADVAAWLDETRWRCAPAVSLGAMRDAVEMLHRVHIIEREPEIEELVATSICALADELPQALYDYRVGGVRDALARANRSFGPLDYEELNLLGEVERFYDYGTASCLEAVRLLGIRRGERVVEVGSRIGAASRFLNHHAGCKVTGIERVPALVAVARDLTRRCGMAQEVSFEVADITSASLPAEHFDHALALMVMLHVKDRAAAWQRCAGALRAGQCLLVEDLLLTRPLDEAQRMLVTSVLDAPNLVDQTAYERELAAAGFVDVRAQDLTDVWKVWSKEREAQFVQEREQHTRTHGAEIYESRRLFLRLMRDLFDIGQLRAVRFIARKPLPSLP